MTARKPLSTWQMANTPDTWPLHIRRNVGPGDGDCWLWLRSVNRDGYGWACLDNKTWQAHRLAYVLTNGPIPDGLVIDHLCRVRRCVNPAHMEPVTSRENLMRSPITQLGMTTCRLGHPLERWYGQRRCMICLAEYNRQHARRRAA